MTDKSSRPAFWSHLEHSLNARMERGLSRKCIVSQPLCPTTISRNGSIAINFGANDYLGLAWNPEVLQAAFEATQSVRKFGSGASPLVTGQTAEHANLVQSIACFKEAENAIVFSSGYAANVGTVAAIATKEDVIFSDSLNHASLIDGCRLSRAKVIIYPHCDMAALRALVQQNRHCGRFAFVASDAVFSMDGDLAPLREIDALCSEYDMNCVLDEAHATGVFGTFGGGLVEHFGVTRERFVSIGTLSKAIGCVGGFVAGPNVLIDWLTNHARSWIYSTASTIANVAAARKAISIARAMQSERKQLAKRAIGLRTSLMALGFEVGIGESPIVPIYINDTKQVTQIGERLLEAGVFVPAIRPPTVEKNKSLLRISLSIAHSDEQIFHLLDAMRNVG